MKVKDRHHSLSWLAIALRKVFKTAERPACISVVTYTLGMYSNLVRGVYV